MSRPLVILFLFVSNLSFGQGPVFRHLTTAQGLNEGVVESIGQDRHGYIWIGTASGLNRYDGYGVQQYTHLPGDTNSPFPDHVWGMGCGPDGRMYFGMEKGVVRFNEAQGHFTRLRPPRAFGGGRMVSGQGDELLLATSVGLVIYDTRTGQFRYLSDEVREPNQKALAGLGLGDIALLPGGRIAATARTGLMLIDRIQKTVRLVTVPGLGSQFFSQVEAGPDGTVWLSLINRPVLVQTDTSFQHFTIYDYVFPNRQVVKNAISSLLLDRQGELWVTTVPDGLCRYDRKKQAFTSFINDPFRPASLAANHLTAIFQDRQGLIWVGTQGYGTSCFNPGKNLFQVLLPRKGEATAGGWMWGRAAAEDAQGRLWLATLSGVVHWDRQNGYIKSIRNEEGQAQRLHSNSVRGVVCEADTVWMITGEGVNRYLQPTGHMVFLQDRDSLPRAFYFTGFLDSRSTLWIGGRDHAGLYYRERGQGFRSIAGHPALGKISGYGVRSIFEDGRQRLWFGLNGGGLALYDPSKKEVRHWQSREGDTSSLVGNLVTGLGMDAQGIVWVSTNSGIAAFDERTGRFRQYTRANGLPSVRTSGIRVDRRNRVWAGSTQGLLMLGEDRRSWRLFDPGDGLPDAEFADMPSSMTRDGQFIFPSLKGFVLFDPEQYRPVEGAMNYFVSAFRVFNKEGKEAKDVWSAPGVDLQPGENFFAIELTALNYENPQQTWYAYQLEGFDADWIYTRERVVNYTNVPGGKYRFRYKASRDATDWSAPEEVLEISVATVYYKTAWFRILVALALIFTLYSVYRLRLRRQRQILQLETRARELEKEKTQVKYESLKQQLNPHFLFNSLTSLRSLIRTDAKSATGFLDGLSRVYRYVLRSGDKELIELREELEFVHTFIALQKTRFGEGLEVNIEVGEEWLDRLIVPVTLQNLVENAIKHNTADRESPLKICLYVEAECLVVRNNRQTYSTVETSNRKGLNELRSLYGFYTPRSLVVEEDEHFFTIKIPLL